MLNSEDSDMIKLRVIVTACKLFRHTFSLRSVSDKDKRKLLRKLSLAEKHIYDIMAYFYDYIDCGKK